MGIQYTVLDGVCRSCPRRAPSKTAVCTRRRLFGYLATADGARICSLAVALGPAEQAVPWTKCVLSTIRFGALASIVIPGFAEAKASRARARRRVCGDRAQEPRAKPLHAWLYRAHPPGIRCPIAARGARGPQAPHHLPLRSVSPRQARHRAGAGHRTYLNTDECTHQHRAAHPAQRARQRRDIIIESGALRTGSRCVTTDDAHRRAGRGSRRAHRLGSVKTCEDRAHAALPHQKRTKKPVRIPRPAHQRLSMPLELYRNAWRSALWAIDVC